MNLSVRIVNSQRLFWLRFVFTIVFNTCFVVWGGVGRVLNVFVIPNVNLYIKKIFKPGVLNQIFQYKITFWISVCVLWIHKCYCLYIYNIWNIVIKSFCYTNLILAQWTFWSTAQSRQNLERFSSKKLRTFSPCVLVVSFCNVYNPTDLAQ